MESIWRESIKIPAREPLSGDLKTEAAVIGGGMAGLLTAYFLQKRGVKTIILEADRICSGQTQNTTAKITSQHGLIYHKLAQTHNAEFACQYAAANQQAIADYRQLIREQNIQCHFEKLPAYLYSLAEEEPLQREADAARAAGISAAVTTETQLPFDVKSALRFDNQAQFHPLEFARAIARELTIYEQTRAQMVEGNKISTNHGTVTAEQIVFATHFPFVNMPGFYFMRMHQERSYVLALKHAMQLQGMYMGIDEENGWSLRSAGEYLLLGGGSHRTGENRAGGKYAMLRKKAKEWWPSSVETAHWSAQDCIPADGIPYIGFYATSMPTWYVATGFQKWGMTGSMAAARILSGLMTGQDPEEAKAFSPQRVTFGSSTPSILQEGIHAVRGLSRQIFAPPRAELEALPLGHGGVVDCDGEKLGVYKDKTGKTFVVSTRCPHLGCQLEWNPDEKTWDCPCHGSRFDYQGNLMDNPAQEGLTHA